MANEKLEPPKQGISDSAHAIAKAGLSMIPLAGGPAAELFQYVVQPPLEKRRAEWMQSVGERLHELEAKGLDLEKLKDNEQFISAVMQASQAALRTHRTEKLAALRNAILNIACGQTPDETVQHLLLSFIDELSEMHLRILNVFHAPAPLQGISIGGLSTVLEHHIADLRGRRELYDQLWKDLYSKGLVNTDGLHVTMSGNGLTQRRTTGLGEQLLQLISETVP
ncbi:MAG: hypothetical protein Q8L38_06930 [Pseudohongiella sp.]|nr:hypothetical protein [Pseudohongiella sp.]